MKNKELYWFIGIIILVLLITLSIFNAPGLVKEGTTYNDFIEINTLGFIWISKAFLSVSLGISLFFFIYLIKIIRLKGTNNLVNIVFVVSGIAVIMLLNFIKKLGYINLLTGKNNSNNNGLSNNDFWNTENLFILSLQIILGIALIYIGILTYTINKKHAK